MANLFKINQFLCISICFLTLLCGCGNQNDEVMVNTSQCGLTPTCTTGAVDNQRQSLGSKLDEIVNKVMNKKIELVEAEKMAQQIIADEHDMEAINDEMLKWRGDVFEAMDGNNPSSPAASMAWTEDGYDDYYTIKRTTLWFLIDKCTYFDENDDERLVRNLVAAGNPSFIELLIKKGVDLAKYEGILLQAANSFNLDTLKLVYAFVPNVNYQNENGASVLMESVTSHASYLDVPRSANVVRFLLDNGANVNLRDKWGNSVLTYAVQDGNCAPTQIVQEINENIVKMILESGLDLNSEPKTLLHKASLGRNKKVMKLLLDRGLNINQEDSHGLTPLHWAAGAKAFKYDNWADHKMMKFLLKHEANPNAQDKNGNTALINHIACQGSFCDNAICTDAILMLIQFGADVSIKNNDGKNAKAYISDSGGFNLIKIKANDFLEHSVKNAHLALAPNFGPLTKPFGNGCRCCHYMRRDDNDVYIYLKQDLSEKLIIEREIFKIDNVGSFYFPKFSGFKDPIAQDKANANLKKSFTKTWQILQSVSTGKNFKQYCSCDFDLWYRNNLIIIMKKEFTIADGAKAGEDKQKSYFIDMRSGKFYKTKDLFKKMQILLEQLVD